MNAVFSRKGFRAMALAWAALGAAIVAAAMFAWGSDYYLKKEKQDTQSAKRQLQEAKARVQAAKRERDDLAASSAIFEGLVDRGILRAESRLDFVERLDRLKTEHRLLGLEYEIEPQRTLPLGGGRVFNAVDVLASRVKLKVLALHEGDALSFLEDLATPQRGFNPLSRCTMKRLEAAGDRMLSAHVEANCALEWISLKDKRGNRAG